MTDGIRIPNYSRPLPSPLSPLFWTPAQIDAPAGPPNVAAKRKPSADSFLGALDDFIEASDAALNNAKRTRSRRLDSAGSDEIIDFDTFIDDLICSEANSRDIPVAMHDRFPTVKRNGSADRSVMPIFGSSPRVSNAFPAYNRSPASPPISPFGSFQVPIATLQPSPIETQQTPATSPRRSSIANKSRRSSLGGISKLFHRRHSSIHSGSSSSSVDSADEPSSPSEAWSPIPPLPPMPLAPKKLSRRSMPVMAKGSPVPIPSVHAVFARESPRPEWQVISAPLPPLPSPGNKVKAGAKKGMEVEFEIVGCSTPSLSQGYSYGGDYGARYVV